MHLPHAVSSGILSPPLSSSLLSPLSSSLPLHSWRERLRGSCSGDIIMSHFTRVLPSISPRININHPSPRPAAAATTAAAATPTPPCQHNNPFVTTMLLLSTCGKNRSAAAHVGDRDTTLGYTRVCFVPLDTQDLTVTQYR